MNYHPSTAAAEPHCVQQQISSCNSCNFKRLAGSDLSCVVEASETPHSAPSGLYFHTVPLAGSYEIKTTAGGMQPSDDS